MVEGMDSGSGAGMTRVTLVRLWKGPANIPPPLTRVGELSAQSLASFPLNDPLWAGTPFYIAPDGTP